MRLEFRTKTTVNGGCKYLWIDTTAKTFRTMPLGFISLDVPQVRAADLETIRAACIRDEYKEV